MTEQPFRSQFLSETLPTLLVRVFAVLAGIASSVITARVLGVEGRGTYFYVMTLALLAMQFGHLGMVSTNTFIAAKNPEKLPQVVANSFWISGIVGGVSVIGIVASELVWGDPARTHLLWIFPVMVPSMLFALLVSNTLVGLGRMGLFNLYSLLAAAFQLVALVIVVWFGGRLFEIAWVSAFSALIPSLFLWRIVWRLGARQFRPDWDLFASNFSYSARLYLTILAPFVVARLNVILLDNLATTRDLGVYSIVVQIMDAMMILPTTFALLLFPRLVKAQQGRFQQTLKLAGIVGGIMVLAGGGVGLLNPYLVPLLFGDSFREVSDVYWWVLPGIIAFSVISVISQYLSAERIPLSNIIGWALAIAIIYVVGSYFVPVYAAKGGAMALSVTYAITMIGFIAISARHSVIKKTK